MGKINKYANLYNKEGKLIRKTSNGILKDITIQELEEMIDKYDGDKDSRELGNMKMMLFRMYNLYGNPHEAELIERIKAEAAKKTNPEEITNKLQELNDYIEENKTVNLELEKPWVEDGTDEMVAELNDDIIDGLVNHLINENDPTTDAYEDMSKGGILNQIDIMEFEAGKKHVIQAA